ncbi:MAG: 4Fe-4S binding protein [candidate division WS1 bacterium]|jgi:formate hydrogenlyase subunit 6/NADH:ubiquinone oxidoreductase subunit I|nr:4Fe-4S binding protein [candidate division WS1 bacterium]
MAKTVGVMLRELMSHLFRKPVTVMYPSQRLTPPERFRGRLIWNDDLCIRCNLCVRDCPNEVLALVERPDGSVDDKGKPIRDLVGKMDRCSSCGQCEWVCPKDALRFERVFEMAQPSRENFKLYVEHNPPAAPPEAEQDGADDAPEDAEAEKPDVS